jgi:hypothetical protein
MEINLQFEYKITDEPKAVGVYLLNSGPKQVHISVSKTIL